MICFILDSHHCTTLSGVYFNHMVCRTLRLRLCYVVLRCRFDLTQVQRTRTFHAHRTICLLFTQLHDVHYFDI